MAALDKVGGHILRTEFRRDARCFLEEFVKWVLSTVASRSIIRQGLSCFCPPTVVGGDAIAPFELFNKLVDGHLEKGWTRGSEVETCGTEYQSFVQEQRQLEWSSTRSRPDIGDVLSFCSAQAGFGFCARHNLYKVCIVSNQACGFDPYELSCPSYELLLFKIFQFTTLEIRGPATRGKKIMIDLDCVAINKEEVCGVLLCVQEFVRSPHFTKRNFYSESGLTMLSESVAIADSR